MLDWVRVPDPALGAAGAGPSRRRKVDRGIWAILTRLARYVRPHLGRLGLAYTFMIVLAATGAVYAFLAGPALRYILTGEIGGLLRTADGSLRGVWTALPAGWLAAVEGLDRQSALLVLPAFIVATALIKGLAQTGQFYLMGSISQRVLLRLRTQLFDHLLGLPPFFYIQQTQGDLVSRLMNDAHVVEQALFYGYAPLLRDTLSILALVIFCFVLDPYLALFTFVVIPVSALPVVRFTRWLKRVSGRGQTAMGEMSGLGVEVVGGIRVVQAFGMEAREARRFAEAAGRFLRQMRVSYFIRAIRTPLMEVLGALGLAGLLLWVGRSLLSGSLDPTHFISFFIAIVMMYDPLKKLGNTGEFLATGAAAAERIFAVLDTRSPIRDPERPAAWTGFREAIGFEDVSFDYVGDPVLRGVDLRVPKGQVVAVVGRSGAGKTTLVNLLPRFYDVTGGRIALDGVDIRDLRLRDLRGQLAVVTQETILFNDTVYQNILYGRPDATPAQVHAAADAAYATEFIAALPQGFDTPIGERGAILSGGQRQRLAIARALLKDAPILILDEATSALDTESERMVQAAIDNLVAGRTAIVIAHRLSTIRKANQIAVLAEGRVLERGSHEELLALGGEYRRLYELQFAE